ncbi:NAD(P)-dependent oxidoreductase [Cellvibrio sp. pealriver]|uniref:NAD-dependent epimerase/dehydratase family protein n=1 Tax=Cellvibrio sp. pealriver TaxID=1622269 RepID=UPI00066FCE8F|nr:NAD(P)-dependent oxidoreductase [Cellvibrio sp. pealriver]
MKQVAVLGANSMLGQALCQQLAGKNISVIRIGRSSDSDIQFDLSGDNVDLSKIQLKADTFFHCAASFGGDDDAGIALNLKVNAHSALKVALLSTQLGCQKFIYAGTLSSRPDFDPSGYNSYGFSKALAEQQFTWLLKKSGIDFCSLRFTQLYDTFGRCIRHQLWICRAIAYAAKGADLNMPSASAARNFLHVDDAARMLRHAAVNDVTGIFDAIYPQTIAMQELVELAYKVFNRGGRYQCDPAKVPFREVVYPDGASCWRALSFVPEISLENTFATIKSMNLEGNFGSVDPN